MEAYLNLAPLRGEAQGIGAGAATLFAKRPDAMSRTDALLFAAILPNPAADPATLGRRACRLAHAAADGTLCRGLMLGAANLAAPERAARVDPALAPHLAVRLLERPGMRVTSTLDRGVQMLATSALRRQLTGLGSDRARDGAVIVLDNDTGDVLAYVGGVGLQSTAASVDGARARRQAGSTLKPHLFAQVIEGGWLTAASILDDSPVQLDTASGLYVPRNYDHSFRGPVSVRHALAGSLNVPAVRALLIADVQAFRDRLWDLGYHGLTEDGEYYGFSLALGSAEVSLVEQANAFRALANGGLYAPVRMAADDPRAAPRRVLSAPAAFITADILADASARADSFGVDSALRLPFWSAAKTGTSKAMRDNWCVGFSDRFTVAVWVGNLEGDSMRAVSGTSGAAPVWRDIMLALHADRPGRAPAPPPGVEARMVTLAGTREPPRREYFLAGTSQGDASAVPAAARRPRIANPVSGAVYARDPDIPVGQEQLAVVVAGAAAGHRLLLNGRTIADAGDAATGAGGAVQLPMIRGAHRLTLVDPGGRVIDQVRFTVR
jgi:penicillin-binding protein 1C